MSQTSTSPNPVIAVIRHPAQTVMNLIVALLAPMFLGITGGDIRLARAAAIGTVNSLRPRDLPDLIAIALITAYGLAALSSLSLSFGEDLPVSMTLKLRNNANACTRSAEQNRRTLSEDDGEALCFSDGPQDAETVTMAAESAHAEATGAPADVESDALADAAMDRMLAAQTMAGFRAARQPEASAAAPEPTGEVTDKRRREIMAIVMVNEAAEIEDHLAELPPEDREAAILQAATLRGMANQLLTGGGVPDEPGSDIGAAPDGRSPGK